MGMSAEKVGHVVAVLGVAGRTLHRFRGESVCTVIEEQRMSARNNWKRKRRGLSEKGITERRKVKQAVI